MHKNQSLSKYGFCDICNKSRNFYISLRKSYLANWPAAAKTPEYPTDRPHHRVFVP